VGESVEPPALLAVNEEKKCVTEWAEIVGLKPATLRRRIVAGWDTEKAMTTPV
jgi:hypothetical protein